MRVLDTIQYMGDRLQIAIVVGSVPDGGSGDITTLYANNPASVLFGYESGGSMVGVDVRSLMEAEIAHKHQGYVEDYLLQEWSADASEARLQNVGRIMGSWRNIKGVRRNGSLVELQANVAGLDNEGERYFIAIFRDRTEEVAREVELKKALEEACGSRKDALRSATKAAEAQAKAESAHQKQDDLANQVNLLLTNLTSFRPTQATPPAPIGTSHRKWVLTSVVVIALMVAAIMAENIGSAPVSLLERVLCVLAGVLGTSVAGFTLPRGT